MKLARRLRGALWRGRRRLARLLARGWDRLRVQSALGQAWDRQQARRLLESGAPRGTADDPAFLLHLEAPALPSEDGSDYLAPTWLGGAERAPLRLASTRLARTQPTLHVFEPRRWPLERARIVSEPVEPVRIEGVARPEHFGVQDDATHLERALPPPLADTSIARPPPPLPPVKKVPAAPYAGVASPSRFGLAPDATPATELDPVRARLPMRLPRARASFHAKWIEERHVERILMTPFSSWGEHLEEQLEPWFDVPDVGAHEPLESRRDHAIDSALDHVHEQFLLRRNIGRAEMGDWELGAPAPVPGVTLEGVRAFTGLEFEALQPEPVEPLRMRLEAPPVDMAPTVEGPHLDLRRLFAALGEFPPEEPSLPES